MRVRAPNRLWPLVLSLTTIVSFPAIERLGGVVPQGYPGGRTEGKKLAYDELYKLAGCEGRLKHVSCLERGE